MFTNIGFDKSILNSSLWGIWNNIKETSEKVYNVYKEDLKEFTSCVAEDTKTVINQSSQMISQLATTDEENTKDGSNELFKFTAKIKQELSNSLASFFNEYPVGSEQANEHEEALFVKDPQNIESFQHWCESFDLNSFSEDISQLLASDAVVRDLYGRLVPSKVPSKAFWRRYFFNVHEAKETEKKRAELLDRANAAIQEETETISWSDEETPTGDEKLIESTSSITEPAESENLPENLLLRKSEEILPGENVVKTETISEKVIDDEEINRLLNEDIEISLDDIKDISIDDYDDWE